MDQIKFDLERYSRPTTKATSERAELIERFVTRLNDSRVASGFKPLTAAFYASKMSHIETDELLFFYKKLDNMKSFSSGWWWHCNPKK